MIWIIASLIILLGLIAVGVLIYSYKKKGSLPPTDYYVFFVMGIAFIPLGMVLKNYAIFALGLIYMAIGLKNKNKWKKNHLKWKDLSKEQQRLKLIIIGVLTLVLIIGAAAYFLVNP
ncbi:hypothetical protein GOV08_03235 [Candidatus Woesearchaeota archaeon]|nr:hypothetical protein [Candidatus Woesearchaeota archaeon]